MNNIRQLYQWKPINLPIRDSQFKDEEGEAGGSLGMDKGSVWWSQTDLVFSFLILHSFPL